MHRKRHQRYRQRRTIGLTFKWSGRARRCVRSRRRGARLTEQLRHLAPTWRWAPVVAALQALRGVSFITGVALVAELGDLTRFGHPRELMAYPGLVPSEYSSGPSVRRGAITKAGNPHVRRLLAEAAWAYQGIPRIASGNLGEQTAGEVPRHCRRILRFHRSSPTRQVVR